MSSGFVGSNQNNVFKKLSLVGTLMIVGTVLVSYYPILQVGFHLDDWGFIESVGRLGPLEFVSRAFNPTMPSFLLSYRPLWGLLWALEYSLWGTDALGYHIVHVGWHLINCLLVVKIVWELIKNLRVAILSGLFYASLPLFSVSVFLPAAADVMATAFYLLAIWAWLIYLRARKNWAYGLTILFFVLGLLSKEFVVTLPITLFFVDLFFVRNNLQIARWFRRYFLIAVVLLAFLMVESYIQQHTVVNYMYNFSLGPHIFSNAVRYLSVLVLPWNFVIPYVWLGIFLIGGIVGLRTRNLWLAFIGIWLVLGILPILAVTKVFNFESRLLYFAGIASAMLLAVAFDASKKVLKRWNYVAIPIASATILLLLFSARGVSDTAQAYSVDAREWRAPLRDIARQHPTLPEDSYLYFINAPVSLVPLSGMLFVRYGDKVTVSGTNWNAQAQWQDHTNSLIYYFDSTNKPVEIAVQKNIRSSASLPMSVTFDNSIRLEGYALSGTTLQPGQALALILYWSALGKIDKDYHVFVHLVRDGARVAGVDSTPAGGTAPTSSWSPGKMVVDGFILPIPDDLKPQGGYHLEIGLYDLLTMQRLPIVDEGEAVMADHLEIGSFDVR